MDPTHCNHSSLPQFLMPVWSFRPVRTSQMCLTLNGPPGWSLWIFLPIDEVLRCIGNSIITLNKSPFVYFKALQLVNKEKKVLHILKFCYVCAKQSYRRKCECQCWFLKNFLSIENHAHTAYNYIHINNYTECNGRPFSWNPAPLLHDPLLHYLCSSNALNIVSS